MGGCCAPGGGVLVAACASQKQQHVTSTRGGWGGQEKVRGAGAGRWARPRFPSSAWSPVLTPARSFSRAA